MMQTVSAIQWENGVTLVWRRDDASGAQDIGIEATPQGKRHLKKLAKQAGMNEGDLARKILAEAFPELSAKADPAPAVDRLSKRRPQKAGRRPVDDDAPPPVCIDDMTQEQVDEMIQHAITTGEQITIDITPLADEIEAAEADARQSDAEDEQ